MSEGFTLLNNEQLNLSNMLLDKIARSLDSKVPGALKKVEESAEKSSEHIKELSDKLESSIKNFNEIAEAAGRLGEFANKLGEAAIESEMLSRAQAKLGSSIGALREASGGSVSDIDLENNKRKLQQAGLQVTADQYKVLVRAAHDHTDATATTTEELGKLTEAIMSGSAEALTKYGIKVKEGESRSAAASKAVATFREEQKKAGPVIHTTKDAVNAAKLSFNDLTTAIVGSIAKALDLKAVLAGLAKNIKELATDLSQMAGLDAAGKAAQASGRETNALWRHAIGGATNNEMLDSAKADLRLQIAQSQARIQQRGGAEAGFSLDTTGLNATQLGIVRARLRELESRQGGSSLEALGMARAGSTEQGARVAREALAIEQAVIEDMRRRNGIVRQAADAALTTALRANGLPATVAEANATGTKPKEDNTVKDDFGVRAGNGPTASELAELRRKLLDIERGRDMERAQSALNASSALAGGKQVDNEDLVNLRAIEASRFRLLGLLRSYTQEIDSEHAKIEDGNVSLKERVDHEERINSLQQAQRATRQTLLAMDEREKSLKQAALNALTQQVSIEVQLFKTALANKENGIKLTESETAALDSKISAVSRLKEVEAGLKGSLADANIESQNAQTQEARNAALIKELQIRQQIAQIQGQIRDQENEDKERALKNDFGAQLSKKLMANVSATTSQAQRFAGVAADAFNQLGEGFSSNLVAVLQGQKSFGDAMRDMLRDFLATMTKMAAVEIIKNTAMGFSALATYQYPSAVSHFTAAGIWAGIGVVAGASLAGISAATSGGSSNAQAAVSSTRNADAGNSRSSGSNSGGGPFTLVVNVSSLAGSERGVAREVTRAFKHGAMRGDITPNELRRMRS